MIWAAVSTKILATLLAAFGIGLVTPISWSLIGLIWAYAIAWALIGDWAKLAVYHHLRYTGRHHQRFLARLQEAFTPAPNPAQPARVARHRLAPPTQAKEPTR
jgi:H+-transporting ATPase